MDYEPSRVEIKVEDNVLINEDITVPSAMPIPVTVEKEIHKKELDLDSIDMMQLPIQLDDGMDILSGVK